MPASIYARVVDNEVVQYPMSLEDINVRNNPLDIYYPCYYKPNPALQNIKLHEKIVKTPWILGDIVYVEESIQTKSIEEMFDYLGQVAVSIDGNGQVVVNREAITLEVFQSFEIVVKIKVQAMLDAFAATRGYDDMKSLVGYTSSSNPVYQAEANRGVYLLDQTWPVLYTYFNNVMTGVEDVPLSWNDIASKLPELTWSDPE